MYMSIITVLLILLLIAAWKAPRWVREIGQMTLAIGAVMVLTALHQAADVILQTGDISPIVVWGGIRTMTIELLYCTIVYIISLIIYISQKPRL